MEIVVVLPFMMIGWAYDILRGTFLFNSESLGKALESGL